MVDQKTTDQVVVGSLLFNVEIRLIDANGNELWKHARTEQVSFTTARGESFETARQRVFDRLARWVASHLEKQW